MAEKIFNGTFWVAAVVGGIFALIYALIYVVKEIGSIIEKVWTLEALVLILVTGLSVKIAIRKFAGRITKKDG